MRVNASFDARHLERVRLELDAEHRALRHFGDRIKTASDMRLLAQLLEELHRRLKAHFVHEEFSEGLYDAIGALGPSHRDQVRELLDEHYRFLAMVRGLSARAHGRRADGADLIREAAELAEQLHRHEEKELALTTPAQRAPSGRGQAPRL